jgi:hypothetical protein
MRELYMGFKIGRLDDWIDTLHIQLVTTGNYIATAISTHALGLPVFTSRIQTQVAQSIFFVLFYNLSARTTQKIQAYLLLRRRVYSADA